MWIVDKDDRKLDLQLEHAKQYLFLNLGDKEDENRISLDLWSLMNGLAAIFDNKEIRKGARCIDRQVFYHDKSGERSIHLNAHIYLIVCNLHGWFKASSYETFISRLKALRPWSNGCDEIINLLEHFIPRYQNKIIFM